MLTPEPAEGPARAALVRFVAWTAFAFAFFQSITVTVRGWNGEVAAPGPGLEDGRSPPRGFVAEARRR